MVTRPFKIRNAGKSALSVYAIRSNCGCTGPTRKSGADFERIKEIELAPGEQVDLFIRARVLAGNLAGKDLAATYTATFLTNDPDRPEAEVNLRVRQIKAPIDLRPPDLNLSRLDPGRLHRFTVEVFDDPKHPRAITAVQSNLPECVRARFVPSGKGSAAEGAASSSVQLGRVEVEVESEQPAELLGEIILRSGDEGKAAIRLAVSGAIRPWLEVHPQRLLLPRRSSEGWVSRATVVCRFPAGVTGTVEPGSIPAGVIVSTEPVGDLWHVNLELDLERAKPGEELAVPLRWRAAGRSGEEALRVQVNSAYAK